MDGRKCPRDAKVNNSIIIPFTFLVEINPNFKLNTKSFKYIHTNKERYWARIKTVAYNRWLIQYFEFYNSNKNHRKYSLNEGY